MVSINEVFENAVQSWRNNSGVGTMLCPPPLDNRIPLLYILQRVYTRSPTCSAVIITKDFLDRINLIEFLTHQQDEETNALFKSLFEKKYIRVITYDFLRTGRWNSHVFLGIIYNPSEFDAILRLWLDGCKFKLVVLNKLLQSQDDRIALNKICPTLSEFKQNEIDELRTTLPVEEMLIGVSIPKDTENYKLLEYYNKEITTTLNIFDNFENITYARVGNAAINMSATQFCTEIAIRNGWNDHLDMNLEYNRMIDEIYNPAQLNERAKNCYEMMRLRSNILTDFEGKLDEVYKICKEHENEKILVINKRGEFASKVTTYLNNMFDRVVCGDYHTKAENITMKDKHGNTILVKSGPNKGKPREFGYQAQMTMNQDRFNSGEINILSVSNTPNKDLNINVQVVIITSPLCEDIKSYLYRLSKVNIIGGVIKLYTVFCKSTMEHKQLINKEVSINHVIVNKDENMDISENNFDFVIAD